MAVDTVVELRLDTLYCHREDDGLFGGAEPYLWSALIAFPSQIVAFPEGDQFRVVIADGMTNGDVASIPLGVGQLQLTVQSESIESRELRLAVLAVLMEDNGSSDDAVKAGFLAFKENLQGILFLHHDDPDAVAAALTEAVTQAAHKAGTLWDWIKGKLGIDADSLTGAAFLDTGIAKFPAGPRPVVFEINSALSPNPNWFTIGGAITVTPPDPTVPDPCLDFVVALNQKTVALQAAEAQLAVLQEDMANASPTEKPAKLKAIKKFEDGPLRKAQQAVDLATSQLEDCQTQVHGGLPGMGAQT
jgi:hypothetical protein